MFYHRCVPSSSPSSSQVRQSLQWKLPSGRTLAPGLRGAPVGGGGDSESESEAEESSPEAPETKRTAQSGPALEPAREELPHTSQVERFLKLF